MAQKTHLTLLDSIAAALFKISALDPSQEELEEGSSIEELDAMDQDLWSLHDYIEERRNEG